MSNIPYLEEWINLAKSGQHDKARFIYYERLFPEIVRGFRAKYDQVFGSNAFLISILGFSPEPIILTANAVQPSRHLILASENIEDSIKRVSDYTEGNYEVVTLDDLSFDSIYKQLKEKIIEGISDNIVIDITGGKKSMVCAASIFGKDYNCNIVYVDFEEYIKELRKPMPGSEYLSIVYDPTRNNPMLYRQE